MEVQAGRIFYDRLFLIAPELRPMFKEDMTSQEQKLIDTLALTIGQLRYSSMLDSTLKSLGERHALYGVEPEHYEKVADALIWTVENCLGSECTEEVRKAWLALYDKAATTMKAAADTKSRREPI